MRNQSKQKVKRKPNGFKPNNSKMNKANSTKNERRSDEIYNTAARIGESKPNPFRWYDHYALYTKYAGTIPFGKPIGEKLNISTPDTTFTGSNLVIPGIMTIQFVPTPGYTNDRNSPINRSAIRWYSTLRKAQKASADYDSQDMMMHYMAVDSLCMFHEIGKRIVGIGNMNSVLNRYVPEGLLTAMRVDPTDVRNNIADWWGYVNKFAIDAANVTMPKGIDLRERHSWMCSGLYTDGDTERSQIYMFVPAGFWKFNNTVRTGSQLDWVPWPTVNGALMTLESYKRMGNSLLSAIFGDEDAATISGDTMNAIGISNCVTYDQIASTYTMDALYSEMVLSQIENSTAVGDFADNYTPTISQDPSVNSGAIIFTPKFAYSIASAAHLSDKQLVLNFHHEDPTVEDVIEATRLRTSGVAAEDGILSPTAFGSEIITTYTIWESLAPTGNPQQFRHLTNMGTNFSLSVNQDVTSLNSLMHTLAQLTAFDWHPIFYLFSRDATGTGDPVYNLCGTLCDYDVVAILHTDQLANMHEAALMSEFDVPENLVANA